MKHDSRPVNLALTRFAFPITAIVSILHRISGAVVFVAVAALLYALEMSLATETGFGKVSEHLTSLPGSLLAFGVLAGICYHFVAGIKHLLQDFGIGETLAGGTLAAYLTLLAAGLLIVAGGIFLLL